jgi:predicted MFS family arabinose efflux permease
MAERHEMSNDLFSAHYVWYVVFLLTLVNLVNYMDRMALAVLAPLIKAELTLSDTQLGLLIGFGFALFYAICGIPIARWADHGVRRNIIALAVATWSLMTMLCGAAQQFWHLLLARVGVGAGEAGSFAPGSSLLCDYVPLGRRPGIFSITMVGMYAGLMVGMVAAGFVGEMIGWRWAFVAVGAPGLPLAIIVRLTLREPARGRWDEVVVVESRATLRRTLGDLWRSKTYRALVLTLIMACFAQYGLSQWWPSFFSRTFGLKPSILGTYLGVAIGIGSGTGVLLSGFLANKVIHRDIRLPLLVGSAAMLLAIPTALGTLFVESIKGSMFLVALSAMFWSAYTGPTLASLYSVTAPHMRATAGALYMFLMSVFGLGLGPFLVGVISDRLTPVYGVSGLRYALLLPVFVLPAAALALYRAAEALPNELRMSRHTRLDPSRATLPPSNTTALRSMTRARNSIRPGRS